MVALMAACGQAAAQKEAPTASPNLHFVFCPQANPPYALVVTPSSDCRELVTGKDYADGRVIIGVRDGTSDADLGPALAPYRATVIASGPTAGQRILQVPAGTVPEAVVGLASYPFITFAQPDLLEHPDKSVSWTFLRRRVT